ncbi:hypothetical protein DH2020_008999 [Rehmannia glutinosa]|uniref:Diacylglycerol O-acyltransferase 3, cytosolic n=1 Tax=Rehmannia glutinosa TaxID=99300 RepID=A0ABR0X6A7_REHGL
MDATGVVLRQPLRFSSSSYSGSTGVPSSSKELRTSSGSIFVGRRRRACGMISSVFCDQGHVKYYSSNFGVSSATGAETGMMTTISGKKEKTTKDKSPKKMKKKQLKLLKGLSRDLSTFSQIGFGLDTEGALVDQVKGNMISEAAELLLEQLQKLKAEEKEMKRKIKEEKARLKASAMRNSVIDCQMSSSSSSESSSSDSECGEIVDMNNLKRAKAKQNNLQQVIEEATSTYPAPIMPTIPIPEEKVALQLISSCNGENSCCSEKGSICKSTGNLGEEVCSKKIEVCMGGKCKKSGAMALLEEFQKVVGIEGAVSGCKCMGKCRDGPNVKVLNGGFDGDNSVRAPANSLCIGVGLEDVDMIVANFLGDNQNQIGFAAAC